jgi:beta-galactosidase
MRLGSYQAIAHGADSVLYFQWRASRGGHERFHSAMLPHSGTDARTWREVEALGNELPAIAEVVGSISPADVAVLFDWDAWWGLDLTYGLPRNDFDYARIVTDHYRPLLESHYAVDLISFDSELGRYRVIVIPNAYLVSDRFADALERFVERGGTLVCSFFSGVVDLNNQVRQPAYPGAFRRLVGAYIDEYWPARDGETFDLTFADGSAGSPTARSDWWQDSIHPETARVVASYASGPLSGRPAIVDNAFGAGRVLYLGTRLEETALRDTVCGAVRAAEVARLVDDAPAFVEAARRGGFLFLLNHSDTETATVHIGVKGRDLLSGAEVDGSLVLGPLAVAVAVVRSVDAPAVRVGHT